MMQTKNIRWLYLGIALMILTVLVLGGTRRAYAQELIYTGEGVPAGETVQNDAVLYGDVVRLAGKVDGDVFAIGRDVQVTGQVSGSLFLIGYQVQLDGQVDGTVYVAAPSLIVGENALTARNLYFTGLTITTAEGSQIERDLVAASLGAQLRGEVGRGVKGIIGPLEFFELIMQAITGEQFLPWSSGSGFLPDLGNSYAQTLPPARTLLAFGMGTLVNNAQSAPAAQSSGIDAAALGNWLLERLEHLVTLLVFGLLSLWLIPKVIANGAGQLRARPLPSLGWGLLGVVIAVNLIGVVLLLFGIIIALGVFLSMIQLGELALAVWLVGIFGLFLAATLFWLFVVYVSKAVVAYLVGFWILERILPKVARFRVVCLLLGLFIYVLLVAIPIIGWVIGLLVTAFGLGALFEAYRQSRRQAKMLSEQLQGETAVLEDAAQVESAVESSTDEPATQVDEG